MPYCRNCGYTAGSGETDCRICGQAFSTTLPDPADPSPGAPTLQAQPAAGPTLTPASATGIKRVAALGIAAAGLVLIGAAFALHFLLTKPKLEQLVPQNAAGVVVVDGRWWWDATKDVRAQPDVRSAIQQFEKESKISLDNDVAPWVGQIGLSGWGADSHDGAGVGYLEIRDWAAFGRFLVTLKRQASDAAKEQWTESNYHGVTIQTLTSEADPGDSVLVKNAPSPTLSVAMIKGWVIVGYGKNAVETVVDTYQGRTPSLADDATWAKALSHRPEHWFVWGGFGSEGLASVVKPLASLSSAIPGMPANFGITPDDTGADRPTGVLSSNGDTNDVNAAKKPDLDAAISQLKEYNFVVITCVSDTGNGFRFDSYAVAGSEKAKQAWRDIKGTSGGVSGDILRTLPKDTDIAFLSHDLAGWWTRYKKAMLDRSSATERKQIEETLRSIAPLEQTIYSYPGDCGLALTYREGKGFGAVLLAQGKDPAAVQQSAHVLGDYLDKENITVKWNGDMATLPSLNEDEPSTTKYLSLAPTFGVQSDYLAAATSPIWIDEPAERGAVLTLPTEARGADFVALGDFRMVTPLLRDLDKDGETDPSASRMLHDTGIENAHWDGFVRTEPDGSLQQSTWEIDGWNWREAIRREMSDLPKSPDTATFD